MSSTLRQLILRNETISGIGIQLHLFIYVISTDGLKYKHYIPLDISLILSKQYQIIILMPKI